MRESTIQRQIRIAINRSRRARVVKNSTGFDSEHKVPYGLGIGGADLVGVLRNGRVFALEIKTPVGRLSPHQRAWLAALRAWGGFASVARSVDDAMAALQRAEAGASE